jgi:tRNA/rRNA methyltransferase
LRGRIASGEACGVLFGPERAGLDNDDVALADWTVRVPVSPRFVSINLAQTVLILGYEWMRSERSEQALIDPARGGGRRVRRAAPARRQDVLALFAHLEEELDRTGFLRPPDKRPSMVRSIRNMILRMSPTDQDVRTLRGVVTALTTHARRTAGTS